MMHVCNDGVPKDRTIKKHIVRLVRFSEKKFIQRDLIKKVSEDVSEDKKLIKKAVVELIENNTLMYTQRFGRTFIEPSANKPRRVSRHILLRPHSDGIGGNQSPPPPPNAKNGEIVVSLTNGTAFGYGGHPTTRIALRALDHYITTHFNPNKVQEPRALDVGIGSGILSVAALKMGIKKITGTDIDPMAVYESMENCRINGVVHGLTVHNGTLAEGPFDLILANLRTPGILRHVNDFKSLLAPGAYMVLSGVLKYESPNVESAYLKAGYSFLRRFTERRWVGFLVRREEFHNGF